MFQDNFRGSNGFDELRKYMKQGSDLCKEVMLIMQERSEIQATYAKSLSRLSNKLTKATSNCVGTLAAAWNAVATQMESETEIHKHFSTVLHDEICKPLKSTIDEQNKARKPIEQMIDKSLKNLVEKRAEENRAKKGSFSCAKDLEKSHESLLLSKSAKGKHSDKDLSKCEKKCKLALDATRKSDKEYIEMCLKAEVSRQEWDFSVAKANAHMQMLEEERIKKMKEYLVKYSSHISKIGPKITTLCDRLNEAVITVDIEVDLRTAVQQKGTGPNQPEQILIDSYAEDMSFSMNSERRKDMLTSHLLTLYQAIERERKGKEGVEKLMEVYKNRPSFADADSQEEGRLKLAHTSYTLNFLEACHYKMSATLAQVEGKKRPSNTLSRYIEHSKDKQGVAMSLLKLPIDMIMAGTGYSPVQVTHRPVVTSVSTNLSDNRQGDNSLPRDSYSSDNIDDFDDSDFEDHHEVIGRCKAIYDYVANRTDELNIRIGDVINIFEKQDNDWWHGELRGNIGLFPATYVQEV